MTKDWPFCGILANNKKKKKLSHKQRELRMFLTRIKIISDAKLIHRG